MRYEYKTVTLNFSVNPHRSDIILNQMGENRWRLICPIQGSDTGAGWFIFMREIDEPNPDSLDVGNTGLDQAITIDLGKGNQ